MEKLGFRSFFETYLFNPRAKELSTKEKVIATIAAAIFYLPPFCGYPLGVLAKRKWDHRHDIPPFVEWKPDAAYKGLVESLSLKARRGKRKTQTAMPNMVMSLRNVCYFNSAVQCLEALLLTQDKRLLRKNLALREGEDLNDLEERLLKRWMPCTIVDPEEREKALLFKWTFLVMLQAKEFGSSSELKKAILAHREVMFGMGGLITKESDGQQEDAALYFDLFMDHMNAPRAILSEKSLKNGIEEEKEGHPVNMIHLNIPERARISLSDLIERFFTWEKVSETSYKKPILAGNPPPMLMFQIGLFGQKSIKTKTKEKTDRQVIRIDPELGKIKVNETRVEVLKREVRPQYFKYKTKVTFDQTQPIDLSEYFGEPEGTHLYKLVATVDHHGTSPNSGHYTAHLAEEDIWYASDDMVHKSQNKEVKQPNFSNSYIWVFQKIDSEALQEDA